MTDATLQPPMLRDPANRVSRRARTFWTVRALLPWLLVLGIEVLVLAIVAFGDDDGSAGARSSAHSAAVVIAIVSGVTALVAAIHLIVMPRWRYWVHRWEVTDTAVYAQSGWLTRERRIAPLSRVQTVDVERGPLEQLFKLANVTVTTASAAGPIKIHGLDSTVADELVARLTAATEASEGDAT